MPKSSDCLAAGFKFLSIFIVSTVFSLAAIAEIVTTPFKGLALSARLDKGPDWPSGPTVLITHGTLSHNRSEFVSTLQELFSASDVSSLAINLSLAQDLRTGPHDCGVPQRHKHGNGSLEISTWVNWLTTAGVSNIVVLGHSRGGNQTARAVVEHPDPAVKGVILIAPAFTGAASKHKAAFAKPLSEARRLVAAGKPEALLEPTDFLYCKGASVEAASFLSYYDKEPEYATAALLRKVTLPVLVFAGTEDTVVPAQQLERSLASLDDNITLTIIDGAGHFFRDLNADELVELSIEFLQVAN